jgi:NAD(P)-dependent dehydrogenase (short-subunit alcohol dehydrogenase family)
MKEFQGKVAVITGGASGIGRALAERCAKEGMKLVLADVEESALQQAASELRAAGTEVLALRTDVSKPEQVEALANEAFSTFGAVHLLFNNAGVGGGGQIPEATLSDWQWVLGVNLWGVIHGVQYFVPLMLKQDTESYIVNTASLAGLTTAPGMGMYNVSKFGVVALSETLYKELKMREAKVGVSVLCPGWVNTRIADSSRNRPPELQKPEVPLTPEMETMQQFVRQLIENGKPPQEVADMVFSAIQEEKFYILTHPEMNPMIKNRMDSILEGQNPTIGLF